jgi:hypothetical protein
MPTSATTPLTTISENPMSNMRGTGDGRTRTGRAAFRAGARRAGAFARAS